MLYLLFSLSLYSTKIYPSKFYMRPKCKFYSILMLAAAVILGNSNLRVLGQNGARLVSKIIVY